jgi:hypothetical protein
MARVSGVLVRFVDHFQALRRESIGQLSCDDILGSHGGLHRVAGGRTQNQHGVLTPPRQGTKVSI